MYKHISSLFDEIIRGFWQAENAGAGDERDRGEDVSDRPPVQEVPQDEGEQRAESHHDDLNRVEGVPVRRVNRLGDVCSCKEVIKNGID